MKKIYALLITITILLCACQKTPENPVVVNKANGELEKKIMQTATPAPSTAPEETPVPLENVKRSFSAKDEKVEITVDARVFIPEGNLPVVVIEPDEISLDFVQKAAEVLLEGKPLFEPRTQLTKDEIAEKILDLQKALANPEQSGSDGLRSGDPENVKRVTEMFEGRIKIYQELYAKAAVDYTPKTAVMEFKPSKYYEREQRYKENVADWSGSDDEEAKELLNQYENEQMIVLDADLDGGYYGRITVANYTGKYRRWSRLYFNKAKSLNDNTFSPMHKEGDYVPSELTEQQAKEMTDNVVSRLGLDEMEMVSFSPIEWRTMDESGTKVAEEPVLMGYRAVYRRKYFGIPCIDGNEYDNYLSDEEIYGPRYNHENIEVEIMGDEVSRFTWESPTKQIATENENVVMLSIDEVIEIFKTHMSLEYNLLKLSRYSPGNPNYDEFIANIDSGRINISQIKLGMVRVAVRNRPGEYRMMPAWKFFGDEKLLLKDKKDMGYINFMGQQNYNYLTINAVDGSIIGNYSGY